MRVISGKARGTRLMTIEGKNTRPTTDRIKESLFNLIQFDIPGQRVLDLYAGSGALGIEAASRGAEEVVLVERHRPCHKVIEANLEKCHFEDVVKLVKSDVSTALISLSNFDVILMDPPYERDMVERTLEQIVDHEVINPEGLVVIEHERGLEMASEVKGLSLQSTRNYGITGISIYRYDG